MARKPLSEKSVAENVLKWETGGINVDGCRVGTETIMSRGSEIGKGFFSRGEVNQIHQGRFPANFIHDGSDEVVGLFPEANKGHWAQTKVIGFGNFGGGKVEYNGVGRKDDAGSAARFFYCAKASKSERNMGLDETQEPSNRPSGVAYNEHSGVHSDKKKGNYHPTVKPIKLMQYLVKLVTPKNGIVLDPFLGSGTTGIACKKLGFRFIGIEKEEDYVRIAKARLSQEVLI
jgi:site-specific DNA-methyltransferase (adenine-specific)